MNDDFKAIDFQGRSSTTALILAGGRGTRLGHLTETSPKVTLPVGGRPFLDYVIRNLVRHGVRDIILSTGYLAESVWERLGAGECLGARLRYARETRPLGTGGAVRFAAGYLQRPFFTLNGDTLLDCDFSALERSLCEQGVKAAIMLRETEDAGRFGAVDFDGRMIRGFCEKDATGRGLVNGGVYMLTPAAVRELPHGESSLERDLFPRLAAEHSLAGVVCSGFFLDMGIPETYKEAQTALPAWERGAMR